MNIKEIAERLNAKILPGASSDSAALTIKKLAPIEYAQEGDLTFIANPDYAKFAKTTRASAIIVAQAFADCSAVQLIHPEPYAAFAKAANWYFKPPAIPKGISDKAFVSPDVKLGKNVTIAAFVHIGAKANIGNDVVIHSGVSIGDSVVVGDRTTLYPNVVIYYGCKIGKDCIIHSGSVIGSDGFGYAVTRTETIKIPQVGIVEIGDDVEIGALCSVDRAAMGVTKIGKGTKLDSRVQVAHNCEIGERCMLSAFSGLAGSAKIGDRVVLGGHTGVNGHITVANDVRIGAMSGVIREIAEPGGEYIGFPAVPAMQWRRQQIHIQRLSDYEKRIKALENRLAEKE